VVNQVSCELLKTDIKTAILISLTKYHVPPKSDQKLTSIIMSYVCLIVPFQSFVDNATHITDCDESIISKLDIKFSEPPFELPFIYFSPKIAHLDVSGIELTDWSKFHLTPDLISLNLAESNCTELNLAGLKRLRTLHLPTHKWSVHDVKFMSHTLCNLSAPGINIDAPLKFKFLSLLIIPHATCEDWSCVRFPSTLTVLNLAFTSFDQDLSYLEKLMNLDLRGVNLDNWNDVNFPPRIHELNLEDSNCPKTYQDLEVLYNLNLNGVILDRVKDWRYVRLPHSIVLVTWEDSNCPEIKFKEFEAYMNRKRPLKRVRAARMKERDGHKLLMDHVSSTVRDVMSNMHRQDDLNDMTSISDKPPIRE